MTAKSSTQKRLRPLFFTLFGLLLGLSMGWFTALLGATLGFFADRLIGLIQKERGYRAWLHCPDGSPLDELIPGLFAFSALAVRLLAENTKKEGRRLKAQIDEAGIVWRVSILASTLAPELPAQRPILESYAAIAERSLNALNSDLLVECMLSRRRPFGDGKNWLVLLASLCDTEEARHFFADLSQQYLDRDFLHDYYMAAPRDEKEEAWKILGLKAGASAREITRVYRRLALDFHPDSLYGLNAEQLHAAGNAFLKIDRAYRLLIQSKHRPN